jgi:hypothetical protein
MTGKDRPIQMEQTVINGHLHWQSVLAKLAATVTCSGTARFKNCQQ